MPRQPADVPGHVRPTVTATSIEFLAEGHGSPELRSGPYGNGIRRRQAGEPAHLVRQGGLVREPGE
ncbi:hypothetical protein [Micromonospora haikouensis]|uniref:hypothetical protein n=1 Tax=Micromonospora haikouensis TaxID=686309 RepID=UPI003D72FB7F